MTVTVAFAFVVVLLFLLLLSAILLRGFIIDRLNDIALNNFTWILAN